MQKERISVYKLARLNANIDQTYGAELLAISKRSLAGYESGLQRVPDDIVLAMMNTYGADYLGYIHLQNSLVGRKILPVVYPGRGIASVAISTNLALKQLVDAVNELLDIAADDTVDSSEISRFKAVQEATKNALSALMAVAVGAFTNKKRTVGSGKSTVLGSSFISIPLQIK